MLEIGLGCNMGYGAGRSLLTWQEFLPKVKLDVLEFDEECAKKFIGKTNHVYIGDQSDFKLLGQIVAENKYDVIVDDGGHSRKQQIHSLLGLWPCLKPNGIYVIEELFTSISHSALFNDFNVTTLEILLNLATNFNMPVKFPNSDLEPKIDEIRKTVMSVNFYSQAGILVKSSD
jgi:hypothetical protein